jgi:hypothetical protein
VCAAPLEVIVHPACDALLCARFSGGARMQRSYQQQQHSSCHCFFTQISTSAQYKSMLTFITELLQKVANKFKRSILRIL